MPHHNTVKSWSPNKNQYTSQSDEHPEVEEERLRPMPSQQMCSRHQVSEGDRIGKTMSGNWRHVSSPGMPQHPWPTSRGRLVRCALPHEISKIGIIRRSSRCIY